MPSEPGKALAPHKQARLDQWNARLDGVVGNTVTHLRYGDCVKPAGACLGTAAAETIGKLVPIEAKMLLEIAIARLAVQRSTIYEPRFVCFVPNRPGEDPDDHEHDTALECRWGWVCNITGCSFRTDDVPCPAHAPTDVPALRLVECNTEPRHWIWVHRNDDYGHGCPSCWSEKLTADLKPLKHMVQLRQHRWCWFLNRAKDVLVWCRLMRVSSWGNAGGYCWHTNARWRWVK